MPFAVAALIENRLMPSDGTKRTSFRVVMVVSSSFSLISTLTSPNPRTSSWVSPIPAEGDRYELEEKKKGRSH